MMTEKQIKEKLVDNTFTREEIEFLRKADLWVADVQFESPFFEAVPEDDNLVYVGERNNLYGQAGTFKAYVVKSNAEAWLKFRSRRTHDVAKDFILWAFLVNSRKKDISDLRAWDCVDISQKNFSYEDVLTYVKETHNDDRTSPIWELDTLLRHRIVDLYEDEWATYDAESWNDETMKSA